MISRRGLISALNARKVSEWVVVERGQEVAIADEAAAAADLVRTKDGGVPAAVVRGLERHVTAEDGPGVAPLLRPPGEDLFL